MRNVLQFILKYLAKAVLWRTRPFVIGVTGSVGKSSTKEALFAVFNRRYPNRVRRNKKNLNTEIGVPLTIIGGVDARRNIALWLFNILKGVGVFLLPIRYPRVLILEMAADKPGDIAYLTSLVRPHIGMVTAIGEMPVHTENFSSREELVEEKTLLISRTQENGTVVLNHDDQTVRDMQKKAQSSVQVLTYGVESEANLRAEDVRVQVEDTAKKPTIKTRCKIVYGGSTVPFALKNRADTGALYAALAAITAGIAAGINILSSVEALQTLPGLAGRMQVIPGIKNTIIIDDSYNAAPLSTQAALDTLALFSERRKVVVLGDMLELGPYTETAHRTAGEQAAQVADVLFFVGGAMRFASEQAKKRGAEAHWFATSAEAAPLVQDMLNPGDVVLVKGSQSVRMEKIIEEIMAEPDKAPELLVRQSKQWKNK